MPDYWRRIRSSSCCWSVNPQPGGKTERLVKRLGLVDRIQFVSGITTEQMVQYYAEASIAVVPSVYEGFGLPAGEAMACGVPVVSTDGGACQRWWATPVLLCR